MKLRCNIRWTDKEFEDEENIKKRFLLMYLRKARVIKTKYFYYSVQEGRECCRMWQLCQKMQNFKKPFYTILYNNTCSFCIFIGRELCVIKVHTHGSRQLMAWSNLANLFRGSSHDFCQLYYSIKQIDFIFLCVCTVIDHRWRHSVCEGQKVTHSTASRAYFFVLHTLWRHLWSIIVQTHAKMKSIC